MDLVIVKRLGSKNGWRVDFEVWELPSDVLPNVR